MGRSATEKQRAARRHRAEQNRQKKYRRKHRDINYKATKQQRETS